MWNLLLIVIASIFLTKSTAPEPVFEIIKFPQLIVYEPKQKPANISVYFHGGCGYPKKRCALFNSEETLLICPGAKYKCGKNRGTWWLHKSPAQIEKSISLVKAMYKDEILEGNRTAVGFSWGAFMAAELIQKDSRYTKAIIISGDVSIKYEKVIGKEIVLAAGKKDLTYGRLKYLNKKLGSRGIKSKFFELGNIGHDVPKNILELLK